MAEPAPNENTPEALREQAAALWSQHGEIQGLLETDPDDEEVKALLDDIEVEIDRVIAILNAHDLKSNTIKSNSCCLMKWGEDWVAAILREVTPPARLKRVEFVVDVIGYGQRKAVNREELKPWQDPPIKIVPGMKCYGVHPTDGRWREGVIDRIGLNHNYTVQFTNKELNPNSQELPITHVKFGRHLQELRQQAPLTEEQRQAKLAAKREKKKRTEASKKILRQEVMEQNADQWAAFRNDDDDEDEPPRLRARKETS